MGSEAGLPWLPPEAPGSSLTRAKASDKRPHRDRPDMGLGVPLFVAAPGPYWPPAGTSARTGPLESSRPLRVPIRPTHARPPSTIA